MTDRNIDRRTFIRATGALAGLAAAGLPSLGRGAGRRAPVTIAGGATNFEREPLARPYGFKGGFISEAWQTAAFLESTSGARVVGLGTQNVLWSDADVFTAYSEGGGNAVMYAMTDWALQRARGRSFETPIELLDGLLVEVHDYGRRITGNPDLRLTFAMNALIALDNAAWLLYAAEHGITTFDEMIPEPYRAGLSYRHQKVASLPSLSYGIGVEEVVRMVEAGHFFLKIKLGHPGTQEEMLAQDMAWIGAIHEAVAGRRTPHTPDGRLPYYFDFNMRYERKETLERLLDHARAIGAFDRIVLLEDPFPEEVEVDVSDLGVAVAADETAHTPERMLERVDMGYGAVALKPIAKTLSMTLAVIRAAHERGVPCFCADLTVNPVLVDWNKNVAARLAPLPGFDFGVQEANGHQNYRDWERMVGYHPRGDAPWVESRDGVFELGDAFYAEGGGIFTTPSHYAGLFPRVEM